MLLFPCSFVKLSLLLESDPFYAPIKYFQFFLIAAHVTPIVLSKIWKLEKKKVYKKKLLHLNSKHTHRQTHTSNNLVCELGSSGLWKRF